MKRSSMLSLLCTVTWSLLSVVGAQAQAGAEAKVQSAKSAAPPSIVSDATIMDWPTEAGGEMTVLHDGTNSWTCLPDLPTTTGNDPMCLDEPWLAWVDAWVNKKTLQITRMGFGYMLRGGSPESNTDPYSEGPTPDNEWMAEGVPHLMILVPDASMLRGLPTTPQGGGPWVMWRDTPYVHIMAPMPQYQPDGT